MLRVLAFVVLCLASSGLAAPSAIRIKTRGTGRIIGGTPADIANYPWMVSFQNMGSHYCGASIITTNWVLTAAHCTDGVNLGLVTFRAGTSTRESGGVVLAAVFGYVHGWFSMETLDYDIAVIQVGESFPIGSTTQIVGLPADGYDPPGGLAVTATGWGYIAAEGPMPSTLLKVDISVIDRASCAARFGATERMICAGEAGSSVCFGDSGSPLVSGTTQVGIASWATQYCDDAGGFSNVGNLRSFITATVGI